VVEGGRTIYRLGGHVAVDLSTAADFVEVAERAEDPAEALVAARQALVLLDQGDVLAPEPCAKWAEPARGQRTMLVRRGRLTAAKGALRAGDLCTARYAALRAVADDPFDEAAYRTLMEVYVAGDEPARALLAYESLRVTLAEQLGTDPATATRDLHVSILRGGQAGTSSIQPRMSSAVSIPTTSG
jgi:DNA-binding SARP family transcriptional activator